MDSGEMDLQEWFVQFVEGGMNGKLCQGKLYIHQTHQHFAIQVIQIKNPQINITKRAIFMHYTLNLTEKVHVIYAKIISF